MEYDKIKNKMKDRGKSMVFVGYSLKHAMKVYHMYDTYTRGIITTRDIMWLDLMYNEWIKNKK